MKRSFEGKIYRLGLRLARVVVRRKREYVGEMVFSDGSTQFTDRGILKEGDVVFLGDSITFLSNWKNAFPGVSTSNRGVGGNTTENVLARLPQILEAKPSKIFLRIGINDLQCDYLAEEYEPEYEAIVKAIVDAGIELYLMPICPVGEAFKKYHWGIQERITRYNNFIIGAAAEFFTYLVWDYTDLVTPKGWLHPYFTCDGIHLSPAGYEVVYKNLKPYVGGGTSKRDS